MGKIELQEQIDQLIINCESWEMNYHKARMQAIGLKREVERLKSKYEGEEEK